MKKIIKVGCCGFPLAKKTYCQQFPAIEINISFYQLPSEEIAAKWRREAPKDFEFTMKAWQLITHPANSFTYRRLREKIPDSKKKNYGFFRDTDEVFGAWERTKKIARILKASIILFQCPGSFKPTDENINNLTNFFQSIKCDNYLLAWEPRGAWPADLIKDLCKKINLIHCVDPFHHKPLYGKLNYYRMHGSWQGEQIDYFYDYSLRELKHLLEICDKKVNYCFFNNSEMLKNALRFSGELLKK
ncbi:MAG: DUF72 domain-containing protein [Elusimicrobiota bacterium]